MLLQMAVGCSLKLAEENARKMALRISPHKLEWGAGESLADAEDGEDESTDPIVDRIVRTRGKATRLLRYYY